MSAKTWKLLNSPVSVWFIGTVLVGLAVFAFESYTDNRDRTRALNDQLDRLGMEYLGRLSQYSEWAKYLLQDPNDLVEPKFNECVTPDIMRESIKFFASPPMIETNGQYISNDCQDGFKYEALFSEFKTFSTVSVLAEMLLVHDDLASIGMERISNTPVVGCEFNDVHLSKKLTNAINSFLNPDDVIPLELEDFSNFSVEELRGSVMCAFYGIGRDDLNLWFTDVFLG